MNCKETHQCLDFSSTVIMTRKIDTSAGFRFEFNHPKTYTH